jgi:hypothetical protein
MALQLADLTVRLVSFAGDLDAVAIDPDDQTAEVRG